MVDRKLPSHGRRVSGRLVEEFADEGVSGTLLLAERPGLSALLERAWRAGRAFPPTVTFTCMLAVKLTSSRVRSNRRSMFDSMFEDSSKVEGEAPFEIRFEGGSL